MLLLQLNAGHGNGRVPLTVWHNLLCLQNCPKPYSCLSCLAVHFWAPTFKWGISIANIADMQRPAEKVSTPQQCGTPVDEPLAGRLTP